MREGTRMPLSQKRICTETHWDTLVWIIYRKRNFMTLSNTVFSTLSHLVALRPQPNINVGSIAPAIFLLLFPLALFAEQKQQAEPQQQELKVVKLEEVGQLFQPAVVMEKNDQPYPTSASKDVVEAHVDFVFDVDETGAISNVRFHQVVGTDIFKTLIEKNMESWEVQAAASENGPVAQRNLQSAIYFTVTKKVNKFPEPLMRRSFTAYYQKMKGALKNKNYDELSSLLEVMSKARLIRFSESRRFWLIQEAYLKATDAPLYQRIYALEQAIKDSPRAEKTQKLHNKIRANLVKLHIANGSLQQARLAYRALSREEHSEEEQIAVGKLIDGVDAQILAGKALKTTLQADGTGMLVHRISRNAFTVSSSDKVNHAQLSCSHAGIQFEYIEDSLYVLPDQSRACNLVLELVPGAVITIDEKAQS